MSLAWQIVKTVSRLNPQWRASVKQFENFHRREHYYSPIPLVSELERDGARIFDASKREFPGIDLQDAEQLRLLAELKAFYPELPFAESQAPDTRYHLNNKFYPYTDGILYYGLLRHLRPRRVIEVGCGFSSAVCLDTNERFFQNQIECTFIEPDPARLESLLREADKGRVVIRPKLVQDVPVADFASLEPNDILFIDSSHVCKVGSDVNYLLFEVLPALQRGVVIHFHDIFYPFEYPKEWFYRGVAANEAYGLRAFLQFNPAFRILAWSDYLQRFYEQELKAALPLCQRNSGSFWLRKV